MIAVIIVPVCFQTLSRLHTVHREFLPQFLWRSRRQISPQGSPFGSGNYESD